MTSFAGMNMTKPVVGFGAFGMNTVMSASPLPSFCFTSAATGHEHQCVKPFAGEFDDADPLEGGPALGEDRLEDLPEQTVNAAHDRHAVEHHLAIADDGAAEQIGRQRADHHQTEDADEGPRPAH